MLFRHASVASNILGIQYLSLEISVYRHILRQGRVRLWVWFQKQRCKCHMCLC